MDRFRKDSSIGELYVDSGVMEVKTQEEADGKLKVLVEHYMRYHDKTLEEATKIVKENIGYMAGYYSHEAIERTQRLYGTVHPVLGTAKQIEALSPKQIMTLGAGVAALGGPK